MVTDYVVFSNLRNNDLYNFDDYSFFICSLSDPPLIFHLLKEKIDKNEFKKPHIAKQLICKKQNIFFVSINTNHFQSSIDSTNIVVP